MDLAAQNQMGRVWRDVGKGIVGVDETPILGWRAVVCERVELLERRRVGIDPLALAAVKVLLFGQSQKRGVYYSATGKCPYPVVVVTKQGFMSHGHRSCK